MWYLVLYGHGGKKNRRGAYQPEQHSHGVRHNFGCGHFEAPHGIRPPAVGLPIVGGDRRRCVRSNAELQSVDVGTDQFVLGDSRHLCCTD
jgi:hypothetical protein